MAQMNFNDIEMGNETRTYSGNQIGFFSLKNDGDEALVRFMHESPNDLDIVSRHSVMVNGKPKSISCLRSFRDPVDTCPLCASGNNPQNRVYIHLIEYTRDDNGNIVATPKIWDRSVKYLKESILPLIAEYGPLTENLFKIRRSGAAKSMDTTYTPLYASPAVYKPELYPKHPEFFEGYKVLGKVVMDMDKDAMASFVATGTLPTTNTPARPAEEPFTMNPIPAAAPVVNEPVAPPQPQVSTAAWNNWGNQDTYATPRPRRY